MIRTVPDTGTEEIELYMRTYYSLLRTTDAIKIQALAESHTAIDSSLHVHARDSQVDVSALVYCTLRLPSVITSVRLVVLGQLEEDFNRAGFSRVEQWPRVHSPGRRRRTHYNGDDTLAVMIASRSDIDDIIPMLTTLQIEWNKIHHALHLDNDARQILLEAVEDAEVSTELVGALADILSISVAEITRLQTAWKDDFLNYFMAMAERRLDLSLQLLAGSQINYRKAASRWWYHLSETCEGYETILRERPVYFVSSNTHSLANLVAGYAASIQDRLLAFMDQLQHAELLAEWNALQDEPDAHHNDFLYYLLKKYQHENPSSVTDMIHAEEQSGLVRVPARHGFDVEGQIIRLDKLMSSRIDPRICHGLDMQKLSGSDALIINIDYPLGLAAFELLTRVVEGSDVILGVYVMGKAATLNGRIGDVMLVNVVHDEHSTNTYLFNNCFNSSDIVPYLAYGTVLDNQKAVTARGTFLQNRTYMDVFYREGYTVLEMEAGPYLSAMYEMIRPVRHPYNEIINLYPTPLDVGIIHYASDTPYSRGHNLGAGSLGYRGMDSTYAAMIAILRRIFQQELARLGE